MSAPRLPSIEAQTVAFVEAARGSGRKSMWRRLAWGGFEVRLRYLRGGRIDDAVAEYLVIERVAAPEPLQRRGWFWRYCQLCAALVEMGVVIENVTHPELHEAIARRRVFIPLGHRDFVLMKRHRGEWPLRCLIWRKIWRKRELSL